MAHNPAVAHPPTGLNASLPIDHTNSSDHDRQLLRDLQTKTFSIINDTTLDFALQHNQQHRLISVTCDVLRRNNIHPDPLTSSIPTNHLSDALARHQSARDSTTITYPVVKWKRTTFVHSYETVRYGNCPMCFRAAPLGIECPSCPTWRSSLIYFVRDRYAPAHYPVKPSRDLPFIKTVTPANPHALSCILLNHPPILYIDFTSLQNNPFYEPTNTHLYYISDINTLLHNISRRNRITHFGMMLEEVIVTSTNAEYTVIRNTIDATTWLFNTPQSQIDLHNQRRINGRTDDNYEPFRPL